MTELSPSNLGATCVNYNFKTYSLNKQKALARKSQSCARAHQIDFLNINGGIAISMDTGTYQMFVNSTIKHYNKFVPNNNLEVTHRLVKSQNTSYK